MSTSGNHEDMDRICQGFQSNPQDFSLRLVVEDVNGQQNMWQLQPNPRRLRFAEPFDPVSLGEMLVGSAKMDWKEKRRLALIFAYSLLLSHDTAWLAKGWTKEDIFFFYKSEDDPDLDHPFLSARFTNSEPDGSQPTGTICHPNPSILTLGILLIEIFNEKPIETWRTTKERNNHSATTTWMIADRIVQKMDQSPSREAIKACLDMDWVFGTRSAGLEKQEIRTGLLEHVITPLQQELEWLSVNRLP